MNAIDCVHIGLPAYNEEAALPRLLQQTNSSVLDLYAEHLCRAYPDCDVSSRLALLRCSSSSIQYAAFEITHADIAAIVSAISRGHLEDTESN
jgi:hypothetical protein